MKNYVTEFIGTFFLVFTVYLTAVNGTALAPIAIGSALMVMVYMGGHISGAHYNPAVSLAVWLRGKLAVAQVIPYMLSQLAGAFAASAVARGITHQAFAPAPGATATALAALSIECLFTFALALVMLNSATAKRTQGNSFYGLAIGFTVLTGAFAGGAISGGAFNPAVGCGPILFAAIRGGSLANIWLYLVGPFLGGAIAAVVFGFQNCPEPA